MWFKLSYITDTDYSKEDFPSGACILDYLRCSITFKTPKELLDAVEFVIKQITNNKIGSMSKILRIKNGFNSILKWNSEKISDYNYVDLKINVIFYNKDKTQSQIVELQFLLDFLLNAKKIGHKYYGIKRKDVQIHSVSNIMYKTNNDYSRYKRKILQIIRDRDMNQLGKHLFLRPNYILSMISDEHGPYLCDVGRTDSIKMFELFLDCIFHFGEILLNEKKPLNYNVGCYKNFDTSNTDYYVSNHKTFAQKYFNFTLGNTPCVDQFEFVKYTCIHIHIYAVIYFMITMYTTPTHCFCFVDFDSGGFVHMKAVCI